MSNMENDKIIEAVMEELTEEEIAWLEREEISILDYADDYYVMDIVNHIREDINENQN